MSWSARGLVGATFLVLLTTAAACSDESGDDSAALTQARGEVIAAIGLEPLAGWNTPRLGSIKSKAAPRFVTATGRLPGNIEDVPADVSADLPRSGFKRVRLSQPEPGTIAGVREDLVVVVSAYDELGSLPDEPGKVYVQLQLGRRDSALHWTEEVPEA